MRQYIDKDALVTEIEGKIKEIEEIGTYLSPKGALTNLLCYINTLEVKEINSTDAFIDKAKEAFCKVTCNGHPLRSTCTSLGTCKEHDNFVKIMKGE